MDLNKHIDYFNPSKITAPIHIIGVGAIGSYIAMQLVKLGIDQIDIWDFDIVEPHNLTNQIYTEKDLELPKTVALEQHLKEINPELKITKHGKHNDEMLKGIVFATVDSFKKRKQLAESNKENPMVELFIDGRIGLSQGQVITTDWAHPEDVENYINLCDIDDNDSDAEVSACGTVLSVAPTVLVTASFAVSQLINFIKTKKIDKKLIIFDAFTYKINAR